MSCCSGEQYDPWTFCLLLGKKKKPEDIQSWQASPLLCFQNQSSLKSALEVCYREIFILTELICNTI